MLVGLSSERHAETTVYPSACRGPACQISSEPLLRNNVHSPALALNSISLAVCGGFGGCLLMRKSWPSNQPKPGVNAFQHSQNSFSETGSMNPAGVEFYHLCLNDANGCE